MSLSLGFASILQDKGVWSNREFSDWFTEFTNIVVSNTCDRVKNSQLLMNQ